MTIFSDMGQQLSETQYLDLAPGKNCSVNGRSMQIEWLMDDGRLTIYGKLIMRGLFEVENVITSNAFGHPAKKK